MKRKNVLFFLIDALRYDVVADAELRPVLTPNIDRLINEGFVGKVIANAGTTQFVLPSLTTQTYPLDYGGYDTGIRHRKSTFAEIFREAGYATHLATSLDQFCMAHDFERGFKHIRGLFSYSATLKRLIMRKLSYEIELWRKGQQTEAETVDVVREELGRLLRKFIALSQNAPKLGFRHRHAERHNAWIAKRCEAELELLEREPETVLRKLETIAPFYYFTTLGRRHADWRLQWVRVISAFVAYSRRCFGWLPFIFPQYASFQYAAQDVVGDLPTRLAQEAKPWLAYVHLMDVHSYRIFRGVSDLFAKSAFLFRLRSLRRRGLADRPVLHDLSLMQVDRVLGRILDSLRHDGTLKDTIVLLTGDHGQYFPGYGPRGLQDVSFRTYREHLEVPLVIHGSDEPPMPCAGLLDSMSVPATLLAVADLNGDPSFKGVSVFDGGKEVVIAENAGRGSADLARKDLYFNLTGYGHAMKVILRGSSLEVLALYDHADDPEECRDLKDISEKQAITEALLSVLHEERDEILAERGVSIAQDKHAFKGSAL